MILKNKIKTCMVSVFFFVIIFLMLVDSKSSVFYASVGLMIWFDKMIPTLFPFMIISGVLIRTGYSRKIAALFYPVLGKLFSLSYDCIYIIIMGFLCGFPMGANVIADSIHVGKISKKEGALLLSFTNNIGPIYFISFVFVQCPLKNKVFCIFIMYMIPFLYGLILRYSIYKSIEKPNKMYIKSKTCEGNFFLALEEAISRGIESITKLGAFMIIFNLLNIIPHYPLFHFSTLIQKMIGCFLEISGGIMQLNREISLYPFVYMILPLGGLSCIVQTYSMIKNTKLSIIEYIMHKVIQTVITCVFYVFSFSFF